ncbi:insulinase family protein, partial [Candidatus Uhrbacteria bacterium]|nr:insulinase family protein [Candidatus Uhrbacteria bacterium]
KGTTRRPETLDISREIDGVGAAYNAFTSKDHTGFYVKIDARHSELAVDILSDILLNSLFAAKEMDKERTVIVEEINMYDDNPTMSIGDEFELLLYPNNTLGWLISGPRENILKSITQPDIVEYYRHWYQPKNMIVVLSGNIPSGLPKIVNQAFKPLKATAPLGKPFVPLKRSVAKGRVRLKWKETEQIHIGLGSASYAHEDKRLPALEVLSVILGGNMSSRLFVSVREKRGLAYMVRAGVTPYEDTGNIMIHAGLDKSRLEEAITVILAELKSVCATGVTADELMRAKEFLAGHVALQLEDSSAVAQWYGGQQILLGHSKTPEDRLKEIRAVTRAGVQAVAKELFTPNNLRLAIIGPYKDPKPFEKLLQ